MGGRAGIAQRDATGTGGKVYFFLLEREQGSYQVDALAR